MRTLPFVFLAAAIASPAMAQDTPEPEAAAAAEAPAVEEAAPAPAPVPVAPPPVAVAAAPVCELHVWPAERFQAQTTGWLGGGLLDAAIHGEGDKARRSHLASALDSEGQLAALQQLDLLQLLNIKDAAVITHAEALDRKTVNKIKERRAQSNSPCYSELIVADVFYQKAALYGRSLKTLFMLREFGKATTEPAIYKTWGGNGLKIFPAKEGEDTTAADAELVDTFKKNFVEATENFARQRGAKK